MTLKCNQCGKNIIGTNKFCSFCGEMAPQKTIIFSGVVAKIKDPKYCPHCKKENLKEALFCGECGAKIHKQPDKSFLFCGKCGEKNKSESKICSNCGINLLDWFALKGEIAQELGFQGDLIFTEKMTGVSYRFLSKEKITIGRRPQNDVVIPCNWVSGNHCFLNKKEKNFTDTSTNGTFINRKSKHIKNENIDCITEFNIADAFTFYLVKEENLLGFRLGAIQNEDECRKNGDGKAFDQLRKVYTFLVWGDFKIIIQKLDGYIPDKIKPGVSYYELKYENGFYYFSDNDRNIDNLLVSKDCLNLPKNWTLKGE